LQLLQSLALKLRFICLLLPRLCCCKELPVGSSLPLNLVADVLGADLKLMRLLLGTGCGGMQISAVMLQMTLQ
jgi:hypothetical protein